MNIKKYMTFHENISEYAMYFKYSLITALIIYNFLYFLNIKTTDIIGAPAGVFIVLFELFMFLFFTCTNRYNSNILNIFFYKSL